MYFGLNKPAQRPNEQGSPLAGPIPLPQRAEQPTRPPRTRHHPPGSCSLRPSRTLLLLRTLLLAPAHANPRSAVGAGTPASGGGRPAAAKARHGRRARSGRWQQGAKRRGTAAGGRRPAREAARRGQGTAASGRRRAGWQRAGSARSGTASAKARRGGCQALSGQSGHGARASWQPVSRNQLFLVKVEVKTGLIERKFQFE